MQILATISDMRRIGIVLDLDTDATTSIPVRREFIDLSVERALPCRPFGITWNGDELYIGNNRQLLVFDRQFQYLRTLKTSLQTNVHQLAYHADRVWAVSPRTSSLIGVDPCSGAEASEFDLLSHTLIPYVPRSASEDEDKHHFNSLLWANGSLFVAAHNFTRPSFINSYIALNLERVDYDAGYSIHGLAFYNAELFWISTETHEIRSTSGFRYALPKLGYARGFSMTAEYFVVAISDWLSRDKRSGGDSRVQVIDRERGAVVKECHLADTGSINDLRLLDEYDYAHWVAPFLQGGAKPVVGISSHQPTRHLFSFPKSIDSQRPLLVPPGGASGAAAKTPPTHRVRRPVNRGKPDELERLRAEVAALRAQLTNADLDARLADRDGEYQRRLLSLEKAAAGVASEGGPVDSHFVQLLALVKAVVAHVHTQGYAIVPDLLGAEQVERVRGAMAPLFATTRRMFGRLEPQRPRFPFHIQNVLAKTRAADEVAVNPLLRAIIGGILGHDFILHAGAVFMSPDPGCSAQELHRDDGSYALLPRPRMPLVVTAAIALDDFTKDNRGTRIVPGSCCWPGSRRPAAAETIHCEMSAGSMLLWDGAMFHGGGSNTTKDRTRRTLTLNYTRSWLRTQYNQYLSIPRALLLLMPPELQSDLGYHLSARGLGGCDNQDPLAYLRRMVSNGGDGAQWMLGQEADESPIEVINDTAR